MAVITSLLIKLRARARARGVSMVYICTASLYNKALCRGLSAGNARSQLRVAVVILRKVLNVASCRRIKGSGV